MNRNYYYNKKNVTKKTANKRKIKIDKNTIWGPTHLQSSLGYILKFKTLDM